MRMILSLVLLAGCDGTDPALLGDRSFSITSDCFDSTCQPTCENNSCDPCGGSQPPVDGGCWVTGIGHLLDSDGRDSFGGNGMSMKAGYIRGEWEHQDHGTHDKMHGRVAYLYCRHVDEPGPGVPVATDNQAYWGGTGRWYDPASGWQDGYWFDIMAEDHGEPGSTDEYYITVRRASDTSVIIYQTGGVLAGGNFQIHPPNDGHPYTGGTVPSWVSLAP